MPLIEHAPPTTALSLADLGPTSWRLSTRLVGYLLRSLAIRVRRSLGDDSYRRGQLPEELASAIRGEYRDGMWAESWLDALAARWGVSLAGDTDEPFPLAAWLPEGRVSWIVACRAISRTDLGDLAREWGSFLATFATSPASPDDEQLLTIDRPPAAENPYTAPLPFGRGVLVPSRWTAILTLTSPLAHGADTKDGNVSRFRAERAWDPLLARHVDLPLYAGNAWRGQLRDLIALDLCARVGLDPREVTPRMAHSLFSGGSIEAGAVAQGTDVSARLRLRSLLPCVDALGGVYHDEPMDGMLRADDGRPLCREAAAMLAWRVVPEIAAQGTDAVRAWSERLQWVEDLYEQRQLTRHAHREFEGEGGQMLVRTEVLRAGVQVVHSFGVAARDRHLTDLTRACIAHAVDLWVAGGAFGAGTARGHGAFTTAGYQHPGGEPIGDPARYVQHLVERRDEIRDLLTRKADAAPPKSTKGAKAPKGGAVVAVGGA